MAERQTQASEGRPMPHDRSDKLAVVLPFKRSRALPDRRRFERCLQMNLATARQTGQQLGIFSIRLDYDPDLCDATRREAFNTSLQHMRERLSGLVPSMVQIARPWHDGLAFVQVTTDDAFAIYKSAKALLKKLQEHLPTGKEETLSKVGLGIAVYPDDGNMPGTLIDHAYAAAKRAEQWGGNGFCFSSRSIGRKVASRLTNDVALLHTLRSRGVSLRYRPVIDLQQSNIVALKGDPFWHHPDKGDQSAKDVFDAIERADLADVYNTWLIDVIRRRSGQWSQSSRCRLISLRAVRSQIVDAGLATGFLANLNSHDVAAHQIEVSFDAKLLFDGTDHRLSTGLRQLEDLGFQLAVFNVGTELLPFEALTKLPLRTAEFASPVISTIGRCSLSERKLKALINFMSALGLRTRSKDVASEEQLAFLTENGCDEASGPTIGPSMSAGDVDRLNDDIGAYVEPSTWPASREQRLLSAD